MSPSMVEGEVEVEGELLEGAKINDFQAKHKNQFLNSLKDGGLWLS